MYKQTENKVFTFDLFNMDMFCLHLDVVPFICMYRVADFSVNGLHAGSCVGVAPAVVHGAEVFAVAAVVGTTFAVVAFVPAAATSTTRAAFAVTAAF